MSDVVSRFWAWYERHYVVHVGIAVTLFAWQLVHLYWLTADVVAQRLLGVSYFDPQGFWQILLVVVDYTEIPAIISTSLLYVFELQKKFSWRVAGLLLLLNSQWLHLFWITDEFVVGTFTPGHTHGEATILPAWLAWVAILIDYLELPVMVDITWRFFKKLYGRAYT